MNGQQNGQNNGTYPWATGNTPRTLLDHNGNAFAAYGMGVPGGPESGYAVPHVIQFSSVLKSGWNVYQQRRYDQAYREDQKAAVEMANSDCFVMGILNERRRDVANKEWRIEVDDEHDPVEKCLKDGMTKIITNFPNFHNFLYSQALAIWYGRMAQQVIWKWQEMNLPDPAQTMPTVSIPGMPPSSPAKTAKSKKMVATVAQHQPVNGDSIIHHFDGTPGVLLYMPSDVGDSETVWTDKGRAVLLRGNWRDRFLIHTHEAWAGDFFDADSAEAIHGLGVRHFIYWMNWMRQEWITNVADWCERTGLGVKLWYYQGGNKVSEEAVRRAARTQSDRTNILIPRYGDGNRAVEGVEYVDTASTGAELLLKLWKHLEDIIERFIIGQNVSAGRESSGIGGTGEAAFAESTKAQITRLDAKNLGEFMTQEVISRIKTWTWPQYKNVNMRMRFNVDRPDPTSWFQAAGQFIGLGGKIVEDEARSVLGAKEPQEGDKVLESQQPLSIGDPAGGGDPNQQSLEQLLSPMSPEEESMSEELDLDGGHGGEPTEETTEEPEVSQKIKEGDVLQYFNGAHSPKGGINIQGQFFPGGKFIPAEIMANATPQEKAAITGGQQPEGAQQKNQTGKPSQQKQPGSNGGEGKPQKPGDQEKENANRGGMFGKNMAIDNFVKMGFEGATSPAQRETVKQMANHMHKKMLSQMNLRLQAELGEGTGDEFMKALQSAHTDFRKSLAAANVGLDENLANSMDLHTRKIEQMARELLAKKPAKSAKPPAKEEPKPVPESRSGSPKPFKHEDHANAAEAIKALKKQVGLDSGKSKGAPSTPEEVAGAVHEAIAGLPKSVSSKNGQGAWTGNGGKAYISHVYNAIKEKHPDFMDKEQFKSTLWKAHQGGHVELSRNDLASYNHPQDVKDSEINLMNGLATFHTIRPKEGLSGETSKKQVGLDKPQKAQSKKAGKAAKAEESPKNFSKEQLFDYGHKSVGDRNSSADPYKTKDFDLGPHSKEVGEIEKAVQEQSKKGAFAGRLTISNIVDKTGLPVETVHRILGKMHHEKRVRLGPYTQAPATHEKPEHLMPMDRELKYYLEPHENTGKAQPADQAKAGSKVSEDEAHAMGQAAMSEVLPHKDDFKKLSETSKPHLVKLREALGSAKNEKTRKALQSHIDHISALLRVHI